MKAFWWICAVAGAVVPYVFFLQFFAAEGVELGAFVGGLFANGAAGGFAADVLISSVAFWGWLLHSGARRIWLYVVVNLTIGLSCALPLYLALREEPAHARS